jgi:hypothetical protein
VKEIE